MNVDKLKQIQNKVINKSRIINIICFAFFCISLYILYEKKISIFYYLIDIVISLIITMIIRFIFLNKQISEFNIGFKRVFVLNALNRRFNNLEYFPDMGFDYNVISNTGMMDMGDRYSSNDYFEAEYKNVKIRHADVQIEKEREIRDDKGNVQEEYYTIFKGKWMIFDFNKNFNSNVQVVQKGFESSKISNWGKDIKYKRIEMEDEQFNKIFRIYTQDEHEAFYILTPSLMEKIKKLAFQLNGELLLCFINNELHVGLENNKDSFEYNIYRKIDEEKINDEIIGDIKVITSFVDQLNLDNNLFKREM